MKERRRDIWAVAAASVVLTVVGIVWFESSTLQPEGASREAEIVDGAFRILMYLSIPVFAFVIAALGYSVWKFRAGDDGGDARPIRSDRRFVWAWLVVTTALAVYSIINPGLTGLAELRAEPNAELNVEVVAEQWSWNFTYEELGITLEQADVLVLPVDTRIAFHITSVDVLHSFWVPSLRIKADAVPGSTATILTTPTRTGNFDMDPTMRVQCAEICGTGHSRMRADVTVLDQDAFEDWVAEAGGTTG